MQLEETAAAAAGCGPPVECGGGGGGGGGDGDHGAPLLPEVARFCEVRVQILGEGDAGALLYCAQRQPEPPHDRTVRKEHCAFDGGALVREMLRS